ncbi:MAG: ATP-binding cassette domain-containing protein [Syntrophomonadales bacterium]|jgi:energy-coupling factor transport system ATP-binding protein
MSIRFSKVGFRYARGLPWEKIALKNINLEIREGETLGIIGPTGSGKTTLLQLMNGIQHPSEGQVLIDEEDPARLRGRELTRLRQKVGLVFQFPEDQLFANSVYEDIAFGPRNLGFNGPEVENRVKWAMNILDLDFSKYSQRQPQTLSGGQKRRVAIAGVLALKPKYLILDEPAAGLDPEGRRALLALIHKLREELGIGVVMVSHRVQDIIETCDRIAVLVAGEIVRSGSPREILQAGEELSELGFRLPPMNKVLHELKKFFPHLDTGQIGEAAIAREIDRALRNLS